MIKRLSNMFEDAKGKRHRSACESTQSGWFLCCYDRMSFNNMHKAYARTNADKILNLHILTEYFLTHLKSPKTVQFNGSKAELIINFQQQHFIIQNFTHWIWHVKRCNIVCGNICVVYRNIYGLKHIFVD